jgi:uncharacterized protein YacL
MNPTVHTILKIVFIVSGISAIITLLYTLPLLFTPGVSMLTTLLTIIIEAAVAFVTFYYGVYKYDDILKPWLDERFKSE